MAESSGPRRQARLVLFINPASGSGRGAGMGAQVAARLRSAGAQVHVVGTGLSDHQSLTGALRADIERHQPDAVVVVGGDGMIHAAAQVLAQTSVPLGLVPAGTGNDFARHFGLHTLGVQEAVDAILAALGEERTAQGRALDLLKVELTGVEEPGQSDPDAAPTTRWVAAAVNVAFDAVVNARANTMARPSGRLRYVVAVLAELWRYRGPLLSLHTGGERHGAPAAPTQTAAPAEPQETFVLAITNGRFFGGGMEATPAARQDDGLLDVLWVPTLNPFRFLQVFPRVFAGQHTDVPEVSLLQSPAVHIAQVPREADAPAPVLHGDGEPLGSLPATITAVPGALRLLCPAPRS